MKIKTKNVPYEKLEKIETVKRKRPRKPNFIFSTIIRLLAIPDLIATRFKYTKSRMDEAG